MATQIRPLGNSFCNYADDTLGGHFEINANDQSTASKLLVSSKMSTTEMDGCKRSFPVAGESPDD